MMMLLVAACGGGGDGGGSGAGPISLGNVPYMNLRGLNGHGSVVVTSYTDTSNAGVSSGFKETLAIYRQDTAHPGALLNLGNVFLGVETLYHRLTSLDINDQWATATINYNDGALGWVSLVSMSGPNYSLAAVLELNQTLDHAVAHDHWLVVTAGAAAMLYDISKPQSSVLSKTFILSSPTSTIVALGDGFLLITDSGYAFLNPGNATLVESSNIDIKSSKKAYLVGTNLYIGGPSKYAGKSKVAKLDMSVPVSPAVTMLNDTVDGELIDFAYDGAGGYFLATGAQLSGNQIQMFVESSGALTLRQSAPYTSYANAASQFFASQGIFYTTTSGLGIYKMP